jgi:EmrB/QacA subfamily drug resistance transporter
MVALDALVLSTALNAIRADLHASIEQLEWTVNAYGLAFAVLLIAGAALGDRFGRRRLFVAGIALFVAASAACALAGSAAQLIVARVVQGGGAAVCMPLALALLSAAYPPELRAKALGIFSSVVGLAVLGGPVIGGAIVAGMDWHWIFWVNLPIGLILIPLALRFVPESFGSKARIDIVGIALVSAAALGLVWGLSRANVAGWGSAEVVAALAAGVVLGAAFLAWEARVSEPMVPLRLFRRRAFASGNAITFFLYGCIFSSVFFMAQYFQIVRGDGPLAAGLHLLPWTAILFFVAPVAGSLVSRVGERPLIVLGLGSQAIGMAWLAVVSDLTTPYGALVAPLMVAGAGCSLAMPAVQAAVMGSVAPAEMGKASGVFNMMRQLGGVVGVAVLVAVFAATGHYGSPQSFGAGFSPAIATAGLLSLCGALAGLALPGRAAVPLVPVVAKS